MNLGDFWPPPAFEGLQIPMRSLQTTYLNTESSVPAPTQALGVPSLYPTEIQTHPTLLPPRAPASSHEHEAWSSPALVKGSTANGSRGRDQHVVTRRRKRAAKAVCLACNGLDFTVKRSLENHIMAAHLVKNRKVEIGSLIARGVAKMRDQQALHQSYQYLRRS
ncbi:hypothetical protein CPB85DRAFT_1258231 [Mucidula mucida]|nr:hypothetical protein CPB85DRAFT_1258231 [Mucidula mucida]